jgi:putative spermidine/putrescine transport system substrate-binding protein
MSDEGQLLYLKGYAHPIRFNDMVARKVVPQELLDKLPPAAAYEKAVFLTADQQATAKTYITENWRKVVFGE